MKHQNKIMRKLRSLAKQDGKIHERIFDSNDDEEDSRQLWIWMQAKPDGTVASLTREENRQLFRYLRPDDTIMKWEIPLPGKELLSMDKTAPI